MTRMENEGHRDSIECNEQAGHLSVREQSENSRRQQKREPK